MKTSIATTSLRNLLLFMTVGSSVLSTPAATLVVTNLADSGPGTLRDRIAAAAAGDTINFGVIGKIILSSELSISKNLAIHGPGVQVLQISGNNSTRVFHITSGSVGINSMVISDGRVVGTNGPVGFNGENVSGAGVLVDSGGSLGLSTVVVSNNAAIGGQGGSQSSFGSAGNGGNAYGAGLAIYGSLTFAAGNIVGNTASGGLGGVAPTGSPGSGGQGWGGGVYSEGTANITIVTIAQNNAVAGAGGGGPGGGSGGGIYTAGTLGLFVSTVASNSATGSTFDFGGGIDNNGPLTIQDCTIAGNQADFGGGISGGGNLRNTILALNTATTGPDGNGSFTSSDYNLIQNTNGMSFTGTTTHNILNKNPMITPLQDNGGSGFGFVTLTMAPLPGSPVIDQGNSGNSDQRSFQRPYDTSIPNASGGNGSDIGSVEVAPETFVVLNGNDSGPGSLRQAISDNNGLGGGNTITFFNTVTGTITLTSGDLAVLAPAIIHGPGPELLAISGNHAQRIFDIRDVTQVSGLTIRDGLSTGVAGNAGNPGFDAQGGGIVNQSTLTLSNCIVRSNMVVGGVGGGLNVGVVGHGGQGLGGGIYNAGGNLFLTSCVFDGNIAAGGQGGNGSTSDGGGAGNGLGGAICTLGGTNVLVGCSLGRSLAIGGAGGPSSGGSVGIGGQGFGGGLYSESSVTILNSTISSGTALGGSGSQAGSGYGGGIYNVNDLGMFTSTIASNSATGSSFDFGGGIYSVGTLGATNCTIAGNQADFGGGLNGNVTAGGTIFAANSANASSDVNGTINSSDYNLLQVLTGATMNGTTTHFLVGQDPLLGPLQNNGGPTLTMALLPGSPAIDKSRNFGFTTDQRGLPRPRNLPSVADAGGGDGSDIGAFEFLPTPRLSVQTAANNSVLLSWSTDAADFRLQSVTNLLPASNWLDVNSTRTTVGTQVFVTNSASSPGQFYRLTYP